MSNAENRRFPRLDHVSSRQIIRLDQTQTPHRNIVLTQNLSACGIRFTTHDNLEKNTYFLIYLNEQNLESIHNSNQNFLRSGDYLLAKVVWNKTNPDKTFKIGAAFLEKEKAKSNEIETFTELVNISMLDLLPDIEKGF
ncbi:hypothetical protein BVY03_02570 [bacterium K02(2017)]|nr:hypothetical protein BVY03_02570 [bacterium K02(2017)]